MNSIDERIKRELEAESLDVDKIIGETGGVNDMLRDTLKGTTGWMLKVVIFKTVVFFFVAVYCIWQFVTVEGVSDQLFWAVWSILSGVTMIGLEMWAWMEINRATTQRSIARLELAIRDKYSNFED